MHSFLEELTEQTGCYVYPLQKFLGEKINELPVKKRFPESVCTWNENVIKIYL